MAWDHSSGVATGPHRSAHSATKVGSRACVVTCSGSSPSAVAWAASSPGGGGPRRRAPVRRLVPAERAPASTTQSPAAVERVAEVAVHAVGARGLLRPPRRLRSATGPEGGTSPNGVAQASRLASTRGPAPSHLDEVPVGQTLSRVRTTRSSRPSPGTAIARSASATTTGGGPQPGVDRAERRDVDAARRAPPTSRSRPVARTRRGSRRARLDGGAARGRAESAVAVEMRRERPEPGAVPVELEVPPLLVVGLVAVEGVAGRQVLGGPDGLAAPRPRDQRGRSESARASITPRAPVEEPCRGLDADPAGAAHRVGDERAVAEPAVAVHRVRRRGRVGPAGVLVGRRCSSTLRAGQRAERRRSVYRGHRWVSSTGR